MWLLITLVLICHFRKGIDLPKEYDKLLEKVKTSDLVIAPIADNKMFEILNEFQNGLISTTQALHALSASRLGKQYVIKSKKALQNLKLINHMFVSNKEKENSKRNSFERANEIETKIFFAKREFRNQGKYIDELLK